MSRKIIDTQVAHARLITGKLLLVNNVADLTLETSSQPMRPDADGDKSRPHALI